MPGDTFGPWKGDRLKPRREAQHSRATAAGYNDSMKVLFLQGWQSIPGGVKPTFLAQHGHEVINPKLPDEDLTTFYDARCVQVIDPFGNRIRFNEALQPAKAT